MSADRLSLYWIYFIIMSFSAVVCAILAFSKIKIAKREFFYPRQQKWAKKHEERLNLLSKRFFLILCIVFFMFGILPSCLDLSYVLKGNYKEVCSIVIKKSGTSINLEDGGYYRVGNIKGCKIGDEVKVEYLPFTRYATITNIFHSK